MCVCAAQGGVTQPHRYTASPTSEQMGCWEVSAATMLHQHGAAGPPMPHHSPAWPPHLPMGSSAHAVLEDSPMSHQSRAIAALPLSRSASADDVSMAEGDAADAAPGQQHHHHHHHQHQHHHSTASGGLHAWQSMYVGSPDAALAPGPLYADEGSLPAGLRAMRATSTGPGASMLHELSI